MQFAISAIIFSVVSFVKGALAGMMFLILYRQCHFQSGPGEIWIYWGFIGVRPQKIHGKPRSRTSNHGCRKWGIKRQSAHSS